MNKIYRFLDNLCYRKEEDEDSGKEKPEKPDFKHLVEDITFDYTKIYEGNISEGKTIIPVVKALADRVFKIGVKNATQKCRVSCNVVLSSRQQLISVGDARLCVPTGCCMRY